jgi:hypothetical protein
MKIILGGIKMISFTGFSGYVTEISDFMQSPDAGTAGCYKMITIKGEDESIINFIVAPNTYFVNHSVVYVGDKVTGYINSLAPVPLIYPPQYRALVMVKNTQGENVKVDLFDSDLVSSDGTLKLNLAQCTQILLRNDQPFTGDITNRNLLVIYGPSTKSIPAQTTPYKIIVLC